MEHSVNCYQPHTLPLMAITLPGQQWKQESNTRSIEERKWPCAAHCEADNDVWLAVGSAGFCSKSWVSPVPLAHPPPDRLLHEPMP